MLFGEEDWFVIIDCRRKSAVALALLCKVVSDLISMSGVLKEECEPERPIDRAVLGSGQLSLLV